MPAILNPGAAGRTFRFRTAEAAPALHPYVAHYWMVAWDLRGEEPYEQIVLPYPAVNVTFKPGRCRVAGVPRGRFREVLSGAGRVFGVRFHPGGFRPFLGAPVATITDRFLGIGEVFGPPGLRLADAVLAAGDEAAVALLDSFLSARAPRQPDPGAALAATVVARAAAEPGITRVDDLARACDLSVRRLQRLFADYVGVSPKWVIRRRGGVAGPGRAGGRSGLQRPGAPDAGLRPDGRRTAGPLRAAAVGEPRLSPGRRLRVRPPVSPCLERDHRCEHVITARYIEKRGGVPGHRGMTGPSSMARCLLRGPCSATDTASPSGSPRAAWGRSGAGRTWCCTGPSRSRCCCRR